jgi:transposase
MTSLTLSPGGCIVVMGIKERRFDPLPQEISLEDLVPEDSFYRRLEAALDLSFVRDLVRPLYARGGRPSVDPVVFFRLQLVLFFEGLRSERELMRVAADRLSVCWYLGYDLYEPLPDHSNLTRTRERFGLPVFRRFFEQIVEMCVEAGLVRGEDLYFDATKVEANASLDSIWPRFAVEEHLDGLFEREPPGEHNGGARAPVVELWALPAADDEVLLAENAAEEDWISRNGRQRREVKGVWYKRTADFLASRTDPDSSPMKRRDSKGSHLGYYAHYVVDGGKARIIVNALATPFEVTENAPMLDLLWRSVFRWRLRPAQLTGDTAYGTTENIAAVERANIRAYVPLSGAGKARPYFSKELFAYDPERDLYRCPAGETLLPRTKNKARRLSVYKANAGTCEACELRPRCTENKTGRQVLRYFGEAYVDRVRAYRGTFPYEKALRKRRVWVEPLFAEAKDRHGLRRFRLRRLEKVNIETLLVASGQNVKRLLTFGHRHPRKKAQVAALRPPSRPIFSMLLTRGKGYFRPPRRPLHDVLQQLGKLRVERLLMTVPMDVPHGFNCLISG